MSVAVDVSVSMTTAICMYIYSYGSGSESESGWCLSEWALAEGVDLCVHVECFIFQPLRFLFTVYFFSQHFE